MTDEPSLLRAVLAAPGDDTPRLVYADWLEENGDPDRAEYIRLAVDLERAGLPDGPCPPGCPCGGKAPRMHALLDANARRWWGFDWDELGSPVFTWRRGFIDEAECSAQGWGAHGDGLRARHPVTRVRLTTAPDIRWEEEHGDIPMPPTVVLVRRAEWAGRSVEFRMVASEADLVRAREVPDLVVEYAHAHMLAEATPEAALGKMWPGVAFHLPPGMPTPEFRSGGDPAPARWPAWFHTRPRP